MKILRQSFEILQSPNGEEMLRNIERAGRTCYKSEDKITDSSAFGFVRKLLESGHEAMIEHGGMISVKIITDRGVSHEIVRHRLFSFAQESTRYVNYGSERVGGEIAVICPSNIFKDSFEYKIWFNNCQAAETAYLELINVGIKPETARAVLPTCTKTEIVVSGNPREWRHFFKLRSAKDAHPDIRNLALEMLMSFSVYFPILFDDITGDQKKGDVAKEGK